MLTNAAFESSPKLFQLICSLYMAASHLITTLSLSLNPSPSFCKPFAILSILAGGSVFPHVPPVVCIRLDKSASVGTPPSFTYQELLMKNSHL